MKKVMFSVLAFTLLGGAGCSLDNYRYDSELSSYESDYELYEDYPSESLNFGEATINGDVGNVRGLSGDTWSTSGYVDSGLTELDLRSRNDDGVAMVNFTFFGGLESLQAGQTYTFDEWGYSDSVTLSVVTCSGPENGEWDYDVAATETTIEVSEGPEAGTVRLDFIVTPDEHLIVGDGAATGPVSGTVVVEPPF